MKNKQPKFKIGDVVILKGGSTIMTVNGYESTYDLMDGSRLNYDKVNVIWHEGTKPMGAYYHVDALELYINPTEMKTPKLTTADFYTEASQAFIQRLCFTMFMESQYGKHAPPEVYAKTPDPKPGLEFIMQYMHYMEGSGLITILDKSGVGRWDYVKLTEKGMVLATHTDEELGEEKPKPNPVGFKQGGQTL